MFHIFAEAEAAKTINWTLEIVKLVLPAVFSLVAVFLGLFIWHWKKRSEPRYESIGYLNRKRLDGLMKAWSLLAYITEVENPKAVILWEKTGNETIYYMQPKQAREYINKLAEMFYDDGYGLLLGQNVKEMFYKYRNHIYGVLLKGKSQQGGDERIKIENEKMIKSMEEIYKELNAELRKECEKIEK
ncbi:MAG: hypothetical protein JW837_15045 [Sedimentisphaerales bacterium]|nr:hypothetical protein [Sedimentisphaerales bacterium]